MGERVDRKVRMKITIAVILLIIVLIGIVVFIFLNRGKDFTPKFWDIFGVTKKHYEIDFENAIIPDNDFLSQPPIDRSAYRNHFKVRGIYVTASTVADESRMDALIDIADTTAVNAFVVDVKGDSGNMTYVSGLPEAEAFGANKYAYVKTISPLLEKMRKHKIYSIARIVTFKDRIAASASEEWAIQHVDGKIWKDRNGEAWLNPYNSESWDYPVKLAEEAAMLGFDEIQFDYVRFPTDGNLKNIDYGEDADRSMQETIAEFLKYARARLAPYGVVVSADVFGLVATDYTDLGLGQNLEELAMATDVICPMVYASHYNQGSYGVDYPDSKPYEIVKYAMDEAILRMAELDAKGNKKAILRPWLQDFSAPWLKPYYKDHYTEYGPKQVKEQIQAVYDSGLDEWLFWNPGSVYHKDGMRE